MQVQVVRPFPNGKEPLKVGQVLDTAGWAPNRVQQLVAQRYVVPSTSLKRGERWATGDDELPPEQNPKPKRRRGRPRKTEVTHAG